MNVDIRQYKALINEEMLVVMRQMDSASKILSYLYLGSEWNASNLDELQENRFITVSSEVNNRLQQFATCLTTTATTPV